MIIVSLTFHFISTFNEYAAGLPRTHVAAIELLGDFDFIILRQDQAPNVYVAFLNSSEPQLGHVDVVHIRTKCNCTRASRSKSRNVRSRYV